MRKLFNVPVAVAAIALLISLSTTATAAILITGKDIKDDTVTGRDIKNASLDVRDLAVSARSRAVTTDATGSISGDLGFSTIESFDVAAGTWVLSATGYLRNEGDEISQAGCRLKTTTESSVTGPLYLENLSSVGGNVATVALQMVHTSTAKDQVVLECLSNVPGVLFGDGQVTAIKVSSALNLTPPPPPK